MGWKKNMRSFNAAVKKANRESARRDRQAQRELGRGLKAIDKSEEVVEKRVGRLEERIKKDPIATLGISFRDGAWSSEPQDLSSGAATLVLQPFVPDERSAVLARHKGEGWQVRVADVQFTRWSILVAMEVAHEDPAYRVRLNWVKKSDPSSSRIFLLDDEGNYYYPFASSLKGEVVNGAPRAGVVAFEAPRAPIGSMRLMLSGVKLVAKRGRQETFELRLDAASMSSESSSAAGAPTLSEEVLSQLSTAAVRARADLVKRNSGCLLGAVLLSTLVGGSVTGVLL